MLKVLAFVGIKALEPVPLDHANRLRVALSLIADASPMVRAAVARNFRWHMDSAEAIDGLIRLLDDPEAEVRTAAAKICWEFGSKAAPALSRLHELCEDDDVQCRVFAAAAVGTIGDTRDKKTRAVLLDGLNVADPDARTAAASGLCYVGKDFPEGFADVAAAARADYYARLGFVRHASMFGPVALPLLIELLADGDVGFVAAHSLGEMGPTAKPAIPALVRALNTPNINTRNFAFEALSKIDPERYPQKKGAAEQ